MSNEKSIVFKKRNPKIKVEANVDVEIQKMVEAELQKAIKDVVDQASRKYFRSVAVEFTVDLE